MRREDGEPRARLVEALLPHVLSKINRVTFGLLTLHDVKNLEEWTQASVPLSRRLLAVPFVGKDIPRERMSFRTQTWSSA